MNSLRKWTMTAVSAALVAGTASAQNPSFNYGAACGCPPLGSRTAVTINTGTIADANGNLLNGQTTLTCDKLYTLDTRLYVGDGQDLYIQPGTVIKVTVAPVSDPHCIVVSRGGQIWANGSAHCPITITAAADNLDGNYAVTNRGLWGGLILLGKAYNNVEVADATVSVTTTNHVAVIEGLSTTDPRNYYGMPVGTEINTDNSGVLRYVSLRHGGAVLGTNNEVNGLTMGSVGTGTTIDHIEVIGNKDDGFEWFGGTVNAKYLVAMHCDDDYIDYDQGYNGKLQFIYGLQGPDNGGGALNQGDNGIEADGDDAAANTGLDSDPTIYNATIIARNLNDEAIEAKERTKGTIVNSVFARFSQGLNMTTAVETNWNAGTFNVKSCTFQGVTNPLRINGANQTSGTAFDKFTVADGNLIVAAQSLIDATYGMSVGSNAITGNDRVDPIPNPGTAATTLTPPVDGFFEGVKYRGAFEPAPTNATGEKPWTYGWTLAFDIGTDINAAAGCLGDLNQDGEVNTTDFGLFTNAYNNTCY